MFQLSSELEIFNIWHAIFGISIFCLPNLVISIFCVSNFITLVFVILNLGIYYFHIDRNAPCSPPPQILQNHCFQFLLGGVTVVPREIIDNGYAKLWGVKKLVHYGLCEVWWIGHAPIWHVHGHSIFYPSPSPQRWLEFFFVQHSLW